MPRMIEAKPWDESYGDFDTSLEQFIKDMQALLESIEPIYRPLAIVHFQSHSSDWGGTELYVSYHRPQTEAEVEEEKARYEGYAKEAEARERATLAHLIAKYAPGVAG